MTGPRTSGPRTRFRRAVAAVVAVVASLAVMTGCGISTPTTDLSLSDEPVVLRFAWWGSDSRHQRTQQLIDVFAAEHPNVTIEGEFIDWSGYWNRLATTFAADDAPDVVQMDELYLRTYADRGALFELGSLSQYLDLSPFSRTTLESGQADGGQYALPVGLGALSLVADVDLFRQYGIPLPDDQTWTWDDFARIAQQFATASGGNTYGFAGLGHDSVAMNVWARQHGQSLFDDQGRVGIAPDTVASWWAYNAQLAATGASPPASLQVELQAATLDQGALVTGAAAMAGYYNTQLGSVQQAMPDAELALLEFPRAADSVDAGVYYKPSMYWSIAGGTEHPAEAAQFVDFLANDPRAAVIMGTDRGIPANAATLDAMRPTFTPADAAASTYNDEIADTATAPPGLTPPGGGGMDPLVDRYFNDVLFGQQSPQDAARGFIDELAVSVDSARS